MLMFLLLVACARGADPVQEVWMRSQTPAGASPSLLRVLPGVHAVEVTARSVIVKSAGISPVYLGALQDPPRPKFNVRQFTFEIPRKPVPATGRRAHVPPEIVGAFVNGMPMYNQFESSSYQGRNIWHFDPLARRDPTHPRASGVLDEMAASPSQQSPIIGFALDGFPVYGPWTKDGRMRSSYRLRSISRRDSWPDGTRLTPSQYGPPVDAAYPLGTFAEDYEFAAKHGSLDECNGRWVKTLEYPEGIYAYFLTSEFPYLLASEYYGKPQESANAPGVQVNLRDGLIRFEMADAKGKPMRYLEYVHERPLHLLVVSDDLAEFAHIHPELTNDGAWEVRHEFPRGGRYRLYADFTPPGSAQRVEWFDVNVTVSKPAKTAVNLKPSIIMRPRTLRTGEDIELEFDVRDAETLQPYLGAWAHFVVIAEGWKSFLHAHPLEEGESPSLRPTEAHVHGAGSEALGPPPSRIRTVVSFSQPGRYKLWAQIQRNNIVETAPFELKVIKGNAVKASTEVPSDAIRIDITPSGYSPARIEAPAGKPLKLAFLRSGQANCGQRVVFPLLGITKELALGEMQVVTLTAPASGEILFTCGMGMYRGAIVTR